MNSSNDILTYQPLVLTELLAYASVPTKVYCPINFLDWLKYGVPITVGHEEGDTYGTISSISFSILQYANEEHEPIIDIDEAVQDLLINVDGINRMLEAFAIGIPDAELSAENGCIYITASCSDQLAALVTDGDRWETLKDELETAISPFLPLK